jgi:hypothetical protein
MLKFPYGLSNFENIVKQNYFLVDKTNFIEELEKYGETYISFLRPRRMGKSLFVSILEYYYGKEHKEKFALLFSGLYIGKNPTPLANSYAVLKFDFSGINTQNAEVSFDSFLFKIQLYVKGFLKKYIPKVSENLLNSIDKTQSPDKVMEIVFQVIAQTSEKIYLIIDEYDHFTNEMLLQNLQTFKEAVTGNGYVRKFYETIKIATQQGIVERVFITGVSPITLDSVTSGFNIISHFSNELAFHNLMGFTETEVAQMLELVLEDKSRKELINNDLRLWYNGYKFNKRSQQTVYNSDMILYFMKHFARYQTYPDEMLDVNIAPDYSKLKQLFEIQHPESNYKLLEKILYDKAVWGNLVLQFSFEKGFLNNQFISFLYYMGYLTIDRADGQETVFKIPNYVIAELYWEYFAFLLTQKEQLPYDEDKFRETVRAMAKGNIMPFMKTVESVLGILSNRDFQKFDEKYIKMLLIAFALQAEMYYIPSERETPAGYIDLLFLAIPDRTMEYEYIFELKYLKKSNKKLFLEKKEEAKTQILGYIASDEILKAKKNLLAYTIVVVKDKMFIEKIETGLQA